MRGYLRNSCALKAPAVEAFWFNSVERLIGIHFFGELMHEQGAASSAMYAKEGRPAAGFHRNQGWIVNFLGRWTQLICQQLHCGRVDQGGEREFPAELVGNFDKQAGRK